MSCKDLSLNLCYSGKYAQKHFQYYSFTTWQALFRGFLFHSTPEHDFSTLKKKKMKKKSKNITLFFFLLLFFVFTWDVGCHIDCGRWSKPFDSACTYEELVSSTRMQVWEDVVCAVPQLWNSLRRSCNWNCRIKWPYAAIADLWKELVLQQLLQFLAQAD